ncbi:MAG TPA: nucleoside kinase [Epulopiscium sp.]|nr:nucleoside kinase [Candidatus Epulonipiscium sp.]
MNNEYINVVFPDGSTKEIKKGMKLIDLAKEFQSKHETPIVLARVNNVYKELDRTINEDLSRVEFLDLNTKDGIRVYQRSTTFLMVAAAKNIAPHISIRVNHHINGGYFCESTDEKTLGSELLLKIKEEMVRMVAADMSIIKKSYNLDAALKIFDENEMLDKKTLFKYRRSSRVNLYELDGLHGYFYGYMVPSTGYITRFEVTPYNTGFVLQFPDEHNPSMISPFLPAPKLSNIFKESEQWARIMEVDTVGALNDIISQGNMRDLILISEALHEKKIAQIADQITSKKEKIGVILVAGPSSSGKTTFAQRLAIQLRVSGMKPHALSIDDYFVNREFTPIDEDGKLDFEAIEAIDIKLFNKHMLELLDGKEVEIPTFNFKTGSREYKGNKLQLDTEDVLIVEGIHGLNEKLSSSVPRENKFKVYISCLTQLNIDYHNRISTTDTRLMRRMVRDYAHRGMSPERTIELWPMVKRGEQKNIFPFQEEADVMFNSALIYELAALKQLVEPLLFQVERSSPYFSEAKRILKFLEYFLGIGTVDIPVNSIVREFVGGSCFE